VQRSHGGGRKQPRERRHADTHRKIEREKFDPVSSPLRVARAQDLDRCEREQQQVDGGGEGTRERLDMRVTIG